MNPFFAPNQPSGQHDVVRLIRRCEERVASWSVPNLQDITALVDFVSLRRNRRIHLIPIPMGAAAPSGLWFALEDADIVVYESQTSKLHKDHIIAHELGHMLCEHRSVTTLDAFDAALFPDLDPRLVRDMLRRSAYSDEHEMEAEIIASILLRRIRSRPTATGSRDSAEPDIADRLEQSFLSHATSHPA
ncbi:MAG: ImmA/IrrE family metallo-endopeptidase [Actinomadura rubrobrunea]|nr:ImmA/IrrE family metallo-endopeptidase [Actinomadura rubrobrunea]